MEWARSKVRGVAMKINYKIKISIPLHVGERNLSDSEYEIKADTIFSALL